MNFTEDCTVTIARPVKAATDIERNDLLGVEPATGLTRPVALGDSFIGVAYWDCYNGDGTDGELLVTPAHGTISVYISGITAADVGSYAYYTPAAGTYTLTDAATEVRIGKVVRVDTFGSDNCLVKLLPDDHNVTA